MAHADYEENPGDEVVPRQVAVYNRDAFVVGVVAPEFIRAIRGVEAPPCKNSKNTQNNFNDNHTR